jgi:hypothetical protein
MFSFCAVTISAIERKYFREINQFYQRTIDSIVRKNQLSFVGMKRNEKMCSRDGK